MKTLDAYTVRLSGLKQGVHSFEFKVDDTFFSCFPDSEIKHGDLQIIAELEKQSLLMRLVIRCKGRVEVNCDYCAQPFFLDIEGEQALVLKPTDDALATDEEDEDIIPIEPHVHELNIAEQIFEMIALSVPLQRRHPEGECDEEMVKSIEKYVQGDEQDKTDPRWDALKNIKLN